MWGGGEGERIIKDGIVQNDMDRNNI